ncbi:MAG: putative sulfate exporter family transporter [Acidobacteriota bacterium]
MRYEMDQTTVEPDYSWAQYLDYMEGVPVVEQSVASTPQCQKNSAMWGLLVVSVLAALAIGLNELPVWPFTLGGGKHPIEPVMLAIILGMLVSNLWPIPRACLPGIKFAIKKLLPLGIILLGARLNFYDIVRVGMTGVVLSVVEIASALGILLYLTKRLRLPRKLGTLLGVGTAICGGTAIMAAAPVIEAEEKDVVFSVATVTLMGLVTMLTLPVVGGVLHLSSKAFGVWAGLAIHQTPQVVAAGFAYSAEAGETATIVKLARVCLLAPVVFLLGVWNLRRCGTQSAAGRVKYLSMFPQFVLGFLGMALLRTLGVIPDLTIHLPKEALIGSSDFSFSLAHLAQDVSKISIVLSMAGVGLETRFSSMRQTGFRPFVAGLLGGLVVGLLMLGAVMGLKL